MSRSKLSALVRSVTLLASVGAPCLALAADLLPPPPPEPLPPPVEIGGGWYLRGDVGVGATEVSSVQTIIPGGADLPDGYRIDRKTVSDQFFAGGGVGYQFNNFLRGDITGEYRGGSRLAFSDSYNVFDGNGDQVFDNLGKPYKSINIYNGDLSSVVVMANGYIDLGTWYGVTPFVGGGAGYAFHTVKGFHDVGSGGATGGYGIARDKNSSSFAWSAQAGLAYAVTPNVSLELAYRYMDLGTVKTGNVECANNGCAYASYRAKDVTSQDVKVGMRWMLGGFAGAPLPPLGADYQHGPVVRKY